MTGMSYTNFPLPYNIVYGTIPGTSAQKQVTNNSYIYKHMQLLQITKTHTNMQHTIMHTQIQH